MRRPRQRSITLGRYFRRILADLGEPVTTVGLEIVVRGRTTTDVAKQWSGPLTPSKARQVVDLALLLVLVFSRRLQWRVGAANALSQSIDALPVAIARIAGDIFYAGQPPSSLVPRLTGVRLEDLQPGLSRWVVQASLVVLFRLLSEAWGIRPALDLRAAPDSRQALDMIYRGQAFRTVAQTTGLPPRSIEHVSEIYVWGLSHVDAEGRPILATRESYHEEGGGTQS